MKKIFFLLLLVSLKTIAQHNTAMPADKPATHGMLIFGTEKIYVSHLPLFHSPHPVRENYFHLPQNKKDMFLLLDNFFTA